LIEIDDIEQWRTDMIGLEKIGQYGKRADLNAQNFTLRLISSPVVSFDAVSGKMEGEIAATFGCAIAFWGSRISIRQTGAI